jgi:signal transduction histidine kinase
MCNRDSPFPVVSTKLLLFAVVVQQTAFCAGILPTSQMESRLLWTSVLTDVAPVRSVAGGPDVLATLGADKYFGLYNLEQQAVSATPWVNDGTFVPGRSRTGGLDRDHVWVSYTRRDSLFIQDVWREHEIFVTVGKDIAPPKGWDGKVQDAVLDDINRDGRLELAVAVIAGMDEGPRGIFTLDWDTGRLLWKYLVGPAIAAPLLVRDFGGDSLKEIAFVTNAYRNGNVANGTDDFHTYVFVLSANGELSWLKPVSDIPSEMIAAFLDKAGTSPQRIVVAERGGANAGRVRDSTWVLDPATCEVLAAAQWGKYNHSLTVLSDRHGNRLVALGGSDDTLRILDSKLRLLRKRITSGGSIEFICSGQFSRSGEELLAVATSDGTLLIYDVELRLRCRVNSGGVGTMSAVWDGQRDKLLVVFGGAKWGLYGFTEPPPLGPKIALGVLVVSILVLLLVFALILVYVRYRQMRDIRIVIRGLTGQAAVVEINRRGDITNANPKARNALGLGSGGRLKAGAELTGSGPLTQVIELARSMLTEPVNAEPREIVLSPAPGQTSLVRCVRVKSGAVLTIEDISAVEYLQRVKSWVPVAQKLAHGIKNPLNTILGSVEQIELKCDDDKVKKYMGYVKDEVQRLRKMADAFMKFTKLNPPVLQPRDINELVRSVMTKFEVRMTSGTKLETALAQDLPLVAVDEAGINTVLEIVIENALEAMSRNPETHHQEHQEHQESPTGEMTLKITTSPEARDKPGAVTSQLRSDSSPDLGVLSGLGVETPEFVRIEIADTGAGIPEKFRDKVFEPYFTYGKPAGTGLGLALAKKIVEDHKGKVELHSTEGIGTTVAIFLPVGKGK